LSGNSLHMSASIRQLFNIRLTAFHLVFQNVSNILERKTVSVVEKSLGGGVSQMTTRFLRTTAFQVSVLVFILFVAAGCGGGGRSGGGLGGGGAGPGPEATIDAFIARYVQHTKDRNSAALADMYTEPAEWTDVAGTRQLSRAEIKAQFDTVYSIVTTVYDSQAKDVSATVSGDTATVRFTWFQDVYNSVLEQRVQSEGDIIWTLKRIGGQWFIAHAQS